MVSIAQCGQILDRCSNLHIDLISISVAGERFIMDTFWQQWYKWKNENTRRRPMSQILCELKIGFESLFGGGFVVVYESQRECDQSSSNVVFIKRY